VDLRSLVLVDGCRVNLTGLVVAVDGRVFLEPLGSFHLARRAPRPSQLAVPVEGVDLDSLESRREVDGAVRGWARIAGTWNDGVLRVLSQQPQRPQPRLEATLQIPPCAAPPGGWPHGQPLENLAGLDAVADDPRVVTLATYRPSDTQAVLVVTATEPQQVEEELRPRFGPRLCVVPSRWSHSQIQDTEAAISEHWADWELFRSGGYNRGGQVVLKAQVVKAVPGLLAWARTVPDGLLEVLPYLKPEGG
jgi:hypothetical protein